MNRQEFLLPDFRRSGVFFCGACRRVCHGADHADACCVPATCDTCQAALDKGHCGQCRFCRDQVDAVAMVAKIASSEQFTPDTCPPGAILYYQDEYLTGGVDELLDRLCDWQPADDSNERVVAWICDRIMPQVDVDGVLERFSESLDLGEHTDLDSVATDLPALVTALETWNARQTPSMWQAGYRQCLVITAQDIRAIHAAEDTETGDEN